MYPLGGPCFGEILPHQLVRHSHCVQCCWRGGVCRRPHESRLHRKWQRLPHCSDRRSRASLGAEEVAASNCEEDTCGECEERTILEVIEHVVIVEGGRDGGGGDEGVDDEGHEDGTCVVGACEGDGIDGAKGSLRIHCSWVPCKEAELLPCVLEGEEPFVSGEQSIVLLRWVLVEVVTSWNVELVLETA